MKKKITVLNYTLEFGNPFGDEFYVLEAYITPEGPLDHSLITTITMDDIDNLHEQMFVTYFKGERDEWSSSVEVVLIRAITTNQWELRKVDTNGKYVRKEEDPKELRRITSWLSRERLYNKLTQNAKKKSVLKHHSNTDLPF
mgnify:CR=1 FL=1